MFVCEKIKYVEHATGPGSLIYNKHIVCSGHVVVKHC